ncbi:PQQ-binding-like beta-propeller repeat protein [Pseudanabaena sp. 'Roaring Creek']|uniref:outer membrane protein assembly factor BamB family protein n=1 Tax=Pseudanabaena sp. 'Roaring Creek' TaxID=1681830 RepID=UPI0006D785BF|nr:PQQ-binding-like beta-propeller repeat protein [Pseudanabaena sp. 'Roaring Creek']
MTSFHVLAYGNNPETIIQPEWSANLEANSELITTDKQLFVIGNQKSVKDFSENLSAIDIASGKLQWQNLLPANHSSERRKLFLENGTIYASYDDGIVGFEPKTGSPKSSFQYEKRVDQSIFRKTMGIYQDIAVYGDSKLSNGGNDNSSRNRIWIFGISNHKTIWSYKPKANGLIGISVAHDFIEPIVQNGLLFLPNFNDTPSGRIEQFTVIDVTSGKVLWKWEAPQEPDGLWSAKIFGDTIYTSVFGNGDMQPSGIIRAIDLKTGKEKWSYVITGKVKAVSDREVLVWQSEGNVGNNFVVLDKETGKFSRKFKLPRVYYNEPENLTWSDGLIYAPDMEIKNATFGFYGSADNNSWVSAFDDKSGKLVWRTPTLLNSHIYHAAIISKASSPKRLIFASSFSRAENSSKVQSFLIP